MIILLMVVSRTMRRWEVLDFKSYGNQMVRRRNLVRCYLQKSILVVLLTTFAIKFLFKGSVVGDRKDGHWKLFTESW